MDPKADAFLREHGQGVLATSKRDGSPQLSTIVYDYDGTDIVISAKRFTAKHNNATREPKVALAVNDGHAQCIVYGTARTITDDPERLDLTKRVFRRLMGDELPDDETFVKSLDAQRRTVIVITPDRVFHND